jgi:hypothetical protein
MRHLHVVSALCAALAFSAAAAQDAPAACPTSQAITPLHLYGTWLARVEGEAGPVTLRLEKHPELAGSVAGTLQRGASRALVAGDVDEGDFTLEESSDGQRIGATWIGRMVDASCGKEIKGIWTTANETASNLPGHPFVLQKQGGWQ